MLTTSMARSAFVIGSRKLLPLVSDVEITCGSAGMHKRIALYMSALLVVRVLLSRPA